MDEKNMDQGKSTPQTATSNSEDSELDALREIISESRQVIGIDVPVSEKIVARPIPPAMTPEQIESHRQRDEELQHEKTERERYEQWTSLVKYRGERYAKCRLSNFDATNDEQRFVKEQLIQYLAHIHDRMKSGEGIVLFGPRGTGKDHLAMAVCCHAIRKGFRVRWQNGMDLFGDIRDAMDADGDSEKIMVERMVRPDILYLSDPLPPVGNLSQFQASMLFRILDGRYSRSKPIICTVNVSSGVELDERMGPQNGDRLRDGALALFCNWPSHRRTRNAEQ